MGKLKDYCKNKNITHDEFCLKCGITKPVMYSIDSDSMYNIKIGTAQKIFDGSRLRPKDYLDWDVLFSKYEIKNKNKKIS